MKDYITVKCDADITVYRRDTVRKIVYKGKTGCIEITWGVNGDLMGTDEFYPSSNPKQFFNRLIEDLDAGENNNGRKQI